jgi:hypothetical protein
VIGAFIFAEAQPELIMYCFFNLQFPMSIKKGQLASYFNFSCSKDTHETMDSALQFT